MPQNQMKKLDRGYYDYCSNGPLLAVAWKDRQMVYFVSTAHVATKISGTVTVFRHGPSGEKLEIPCPPLLDDYVKYMRGVDRGDQLITLYNGGRHSKKWW